MGEANCEGSSRSHTKKRSHSDKPALAPPMNREQLRQLVLAIDGSNGGSESEPDEPTTTTAATTTGPSTRSASSSDLSSRHHHHPIRTLIPGLTIEPTNLVISTLEAHRNKRAAAAQMSRAAQAGHHRQQSLSPTSPTGDDEPLNLSMDVHVVDLSTKQKAKEKENNNNNNNNNVARPRPVYAQQQPDPISQYLTRIESLVTSQYLPNSLAFAQHPIVPTSPSLAGHPAIAGFNLFPFGAAGINPFALQSPDSISVGPASPADLPGSEISRRSSYEDGNDAYSGSEKDLKIKSDGNPVKHKKLKTCAPSTATSPNGSSRKGDGYQKPKQRRYRTERPYVCPHCSARFTLRSNMERHGKHQHPQVWQRSPSNRIINRQKNGQLNSLAGLPTLVPVAAAKFLNGNLADMTEKAVLDTAAASATNLSVKAVIAQQLKRKLSSSSLRNNNNGSETETDTENSTTGDVKMSTAEASPDLASVSQLLDRVNKSSNLAQFFGPLNLTTAPTTTSAAANNNNNNNSSSNERTEDENNSEDQDQGDVEDSAEDPVSSEEGDIKPRTGEKKKSAYSSAPHKISCPHCTRRFPWTSSLRRHLLTHTGQKPFQCSKCPLLFTTKSNCDRHLARKHGGGRSKVVSDSNNTSEDEEGQEPGADEDEGGETAEESEAKSSESPAPPAKVAKVTTSPTAAATAASTPKPVVPTNGSTSTTSSPGEDAAFRCHLCEAAAGEREALLTHMEEQHKDTFHLLVSKGALSSSPPSETSETEHLVGDHKDATHRKVMCVFCVRRFWSVEDLRRHIRSHSGERPFSCPHCLRRFTLKHSMLRHLKKHATSSTPTRKLRRLVSKNLASPSSSKSEQMADRNMGKDGDLISRLLGLDDGTLVEKLLNQPDATDAANILGITSQQQNFNSRKSSKVM